jgi:hypothetical protein
VWDPRQRRVAHQVQHPSLHVGLRPLRPEHVISVPLGLGHQRNETRVRMHLILACDRPHALPVHFQKRNLVLPIEVGKFFDQLIEVV